MTRNGSARNIYLSDATWKLLDDLAKKYNCSKSTIISELVNRYYPNWMEDDISEGETIKEEK